MTIAFHYFHLLVCVERSRRIVSGSIFFGHDKMSIVASDLFHLTSSLYHVLDIRSENPGTQVGVECDQY